MRVLLFLFSLFSFGAGVMILINSNSAVQEIEAFVLLLIAAVFLVGAAIVEAIHAARREWAQTQAAPAPAKRDAARKTVIPGING